MAQTGIKNTLNIILVDDEIHGLKSLAALIARYVPEAVINASCDSAEKAIATIRQLNPMEYNLVFLDIEMPYKNGFEILEELKDCSFEVIFTTAFQQYAIKAFKYNAVDYLLKPVNPTELKATVTRIMEKFRERQQSTIAKLLEKMQDAIPPEAKKIGLHTQEGIEYVAFSQIIRCEGSSSYTIFFLADNNKIIVSKNIGEMEKQLPESIFIRIHKSHLINIHFIKKYLRNEGGQLLMSDGALVDVSRTKKDELMERLKGFSV